MLFARENLKCHWIAAEFIDLRVRVQIHQHFMMKYNAISVKKSRFSSRWHICLWADVTSENGRTRSRNLLGEISNVARFRWREWLKSFINLIVDERMDWKAVKTGYRTTVTCQHCWMSCGYSTTGKRIHLCARENGFQFFHSHCDQCENEIADIIAYMCVPMAVTMRITSFDLFSVSKYMRYSNVDRLLRSIVFLREYSRFFVTSTLFEQMNTLIEHFQSTFEHTKRGQMYLTYSRRPHFIAC